MTTTQALALPPVHDEILDMAKISRKRTKSGYQTVGTTSDGIKVLKPKTKPKSFTTAEIRRTIRQVLEERALSKAQAEKQAAAGL